MDKYELIEFIGQGTYGHVVKAKCKKSAKIVAIKYISDIFKSFYITKQVLREIIILRKLNKMSKGKHVTQLVEIISKKDL